MWDIHRKAYPVTLHSGQSHVQSGRGSGRGSSAQAYLQSVPSTSNTTPFNTGLSSFYFLLAGSSGANRRGRKGSGVMTLLYPRLWQGLGLKKAFEVIFGCENLLRWFDGRKKSVVMIARVVVGGARCVLRCGSVGMQIAGLATTGRRSGVLMPCFFR